MPTKAIPEPWQSFLEDLDATLHSELCFHCIGGFVITLLYGFSRPTSDIDVLVVVPTDDTRQALIELGREGSALHKKHGVYLNCVTVARVPENYEDRLTEMFPGAFTNLRLFALDPYDLALSKLERNIQRDRDDIKYLARTVPLDLGVLKERYQNEFRLYLGVPEREDLILKLWMEAIEEERQR
jgi:Nucleotidyltransferase of unknown function (DUF6036)